MLFPALAEHHVHDGFHQLLEGFFIQVFHLSEGDPLLEFVSHFTYDLLRTFLVFIIILFVVSYCKTYISSARVRSTVLRVNKIAAVFLAAATGLLSSTCVCTNVPLFVGLLAFGLPLHLAMTYLISSSLINIASLLSMAAIDGWKFTLAYTIVSFAISAAAGFLLNTISSDRYLKGSLRPTAAEISGPRKQKDRFHSAWHELKHTFKDQWLWILLGVLLSAIINSLVNVDFAKELSSLSVLGVLLTTLIGVVLHTDIIAVVPVIEAFLNLHIPYGILFSLAASLSFFSIPMILMLKNTLKLRYILISWVMMFVLILLGGCVLLPFAE